MFDSRTIGNMTNKKIIYRNRYEILIAVTFLFTDLCLLRSLHSVNFFLTVRNKFYILKIRTLFFARKGVFADKDSSF